MKFKYIFGSNIPDTTGHHTAVQVLSSPNITWEKQTKRVAIKNYVSKFYLSK